MWFMCYYNKESSLSQPSRELGATLPEGDTQREALLLVLQRKLEALKRQLEEKEGEHNQQMTAGKLPYWGSHFQAFWVCSYSSTSGDQLCWLLLLVAFLSSPCFCSSWGAEREAWTTSWSETEVFASGAGAQIPARTAAKGSPLVTVKDLVLCHPTLCGLCLRTRLYHLFFYSWMKWIGRLRVSCVSSWGFRKKCTQCTWRNPWRCRFVVEVVRSAGKWSEGALGLISSDCRLFSFLYFFASQEQACLQ